MNAQEIVAVTNVLNGCRTFCSVISSVIACNNHGVGLELKKEQVAALRHGALQMLLALESLDPCVFEGGEETRRALQPILRLVKPLS